MRDQFKKESFFSASKRELFEFHERSDAFPLLTPDFANVEVETTASTLAPSKEVVKFAVRLGPLRFRFENVHTVYEPFDLFVDEQQKGVFSAWRHEHRFREAGWSGDPASVMSDEITYAHPLLPLVNPMVKHKLGKLFEYRHQATAAEMHGQQQLPDGAKGARIVVTGATGLIGRRIVEILVEKGARVVAFVRDVAKARERLGDAVNCVHWDFTRPDEGAWKTHLAEADGVIHLAGTPLFDRRWTPGFKQKMEESRVLGTRQLVDSIVASERKPGAFVSASALGFYGTDPGRVVDEDAPPADDLLARICVNWESEATRLDAYGVRGVQARIGIALSTESGALKELLPLFRMGLGGIMGHPHTYINWVHIEDVARILVMAVFNGEMRGPYNVVAPHPVTNAEFAKAIARVLRRPALMRFPVFMLKLIIGEAGEYASGGARARADRMESAGYGFFFEQLEPALRNLLRR